MSPTRRSTIVALDTLAAALLLLAIVIFATGGFVSLVLGVRVSLTSPQRTLFWVCAVIGLRLAIGLRAGPFDRRTPQWQRLLDSVVEEPCFPPSPPGVWKRTALASLGLAAALALLLHQQVRAFYSVPDLGDPLFSIWRTSWVAHQIFTDPAHLFDANIFYPERLTLTLSDPVILPGLAMIPLLALGIHPVVAYNIVLLSGFWLSGIATYLLLERMTGSPRAAFLGGLIYASYSYRFEHLSHLELQMTQWMPLALLALHLLLTTGRRRYALALGLALVAQLYSSLYYAVFFVIYGGVLGLALLRVHRRSIRQVAMPLAAAGLMALLMAVPLMQAFMAAKPMKGERGDIEVATYSAVPADYLRVHQYAALWRPILRPRAPERALFPGAAPLVLAATALVPPLGTMRLAYAAGLLVAFDGSLGLHGIAYPMLYRLPGPIREIRAPARFAALVGLTLSILAAFGVRRVLERPRSPGYRHAMFAGLIAFVMVDTWPALTVEPVWKEPPPIYETLKYTPKAVIAELPMRDDEVGNLPYMYFSIWHWARLVNGYSGFIPESYADFHSRMLLFPDDTSIAELRRRGVTYVSVNCGLGYGGGYGGCEALAEAMRRSKALRLTSDTSWLGQPVQLYEVLRP